MAIHLDSDTVKKALLVLTIAAVFAVFVLFTKYARTVVAFDRPTAFATFTQQVKFDPEHPIHQCLLNERCVVFIYPTHRGLQALTFTDDNGAKDVHYTTPQGINQILAPGIVGGGLHLRPCDERVCIRVDELSAASKALLTTMNLTGSLEIGSR